MKKFAVLALSLVAMLWSLRVQAADRVDLLRYVPSGAAAALVAEDSSFDQLQEFLNSAPQMRTDLSAFLTQRLGVDLTQVDGLTIWVSNLEKDPVIGAFVRVKGASTALAGRQVGLVNGIKLVKSESTYLASVPGGVLLGNKPGIRRAASLAGKKISKKSLAAQGALAAQLKIQQKGDVVAAFNPQNIHDANFKQALLEYGIHHLVLTANEKRLRLEAVGDGQRLDQARAMLEGLVAMAMQKLASERSKALSLKNKVELGEGVATIVGYHQFKKLWDEIRPQLKGDRLVSEYQLPDFSKYSGVWATWAGVMSAFALPRILKDNPLLAPQIAK